MQMPIQRTRVMAIVFFGPALSVRKPNTIEPAIALVWTTVKKRMIA